jgi:hypothetical protein
MSSVLSVFCTQLINFFEELSVTIPEERDIKKGLEMIKMAKSANPRLLADLFYDHVYTPFNQLVAARDIHSMVAQSRKKIETEFNEIMPALVIFDKHWAGLSAVNQNAIWGYMDLLCKLVAKTR